MTLRSTWVLGLVIAAQAPQAGTPAGVVQRALNAHGQKLVNGEIADSVGEGKMTYFNANGPQATFEMTVTRKGKSQVQRVVKQPAAEVRLGSDGTQTWNSLGGFFTQKALGHALDFLESQTNRSVQALLNHQAEGLTIRDKGQSGKSRVIEAEDKQGRKTSYFVDDDSSAVTRLEFVTGEAKDPFSGRMVPIFDSYVLSDYKNVQGVLTPFTIERFINGVKTEEMRFTSVRYNASVKDDAFKP